MIVLTFALPDESGVFLKSLSGLRKEAGGPLPLYFGRLDGLEVAVIHTGVGVVAARRSVSAFLSAHRPELVVSSGFAGGLDPLLPFCAIVFPTNYSTPELLDTVRRLFQGDSSVFFGSLTTQLVPFESIPAKRSLFLKSNAIAVDMETSPIAEACATAQIPFLSMRIISDTALQELPVSFSLWFDPVAQKPKPFSLLFHLASHPGKIPDFFRFVRCVFRAKQILDGHLRKLMMHLQKSGFIHKSDE